MRNRVLAAALAVVISFLSGLSGILTVSAAEAAKVETAGSEAATSETAEEEAAEKEAAASETATSETAEEEAAEKETAVSEDSESEDSESEDSTASAAADRAGTGAAADAAETAVTDATASVKEYSEKADTEQPLSAGGKASPEDTSGKEVTEGKSSANGKSLSKDASGKKGAEETPSDKKKAPSGDAPGKEGAKKKSSAGEKAPEKEASSEKSTNKKAPEEEASSESSTGGTASAEEKPPEVSTQRVLANGLFSVTMPKDLAGTYEGLLFPGSIRVCDKASRDAGFGGVVFIITARAPSEKYNGALKEKKYGELTSADGTVYDITLRTPTDVQFDDKAGKAMTYEKIQKAAEQVMKTVKSPSEGTYAPGAGMKGEDLYQDILKKHVTAVRKSWNAARLEKEGMNPVYALLRKTAGNAALDRIGFAYRDLTGEGVEELLIGRIPFSEDEQKGLIYDIYTIEGHSPAHVLSGWKEDRYFLGEYGLYNEFSGLNDEEYWVVYDNLNLIQSDCRTGFADGLESLKIDNAADEEQPWFTYDIVKKDWKQVTEDEFDEDFTRYIAPVEIDFRPLSGLGK